MSEGQNRRGEVVWQARVKDLLTAVCGAKSLTGSQVVSPRLGKRPIPAALAPPLPPGSADKIIFPVEIWLQFPPATFDPLSDSTAWQNTTVTHHRIQAREAIAGLDQSSTQYMASLLYNTASTRPHSASTQSTTTRVQVEYRYSDESNPRTRIAKEHISNNITDRSYAPSSISHRRSRLLILAVSSQPPSLPF